MLKLTYPNLSYGNHQELLQDSIILWNHQPLCIGGDLAVQEAFFSTLLSWKTCSFMQGDRSLSMQEVKAHSVVISTDIQLPKHLSLQKLLAIYGEQQHSIEMQFAAYFDLSKRLRSYPKEQQLLFQTMLQLQYPAFLLIVTGDWTSYPDTVQLLQKWMDKRMQQDGYILLSEGAKGLFTTMESVDLCQPKRQGTGLFLEEEVPLASVHIHQPTLSLRMIQYPWPRLMFQFLYVLSATVLLALVILITQFHSINIKAYEQSIQKVEQGQSYALSLSPSNAYHWKDEFTIMSMLSQEQERYLAQLFPQIPLYAMKEGELQIIYKGKKAEISRGEQRLHINQQFEDSTVSITNAMLSIPQKLASFYFQDEPTDTRGIYLMEEFAKQYGIQQGDILHVPVNLPLRAYPENSGLSQYQSDTKDILYVPLYETIEVELTVKQLIKDPYTLAALCGQNYVEAWIDEELYEQLKSQIKNDALYQIGDEPKNYSQEAYRYQSFPDGANTALIPYSSRAYLYLASSQAELKQIKETLDQDTYLYMRTMDPLTSIQEISETLKEEKTTFQTAMQSILWGLGGITICCCLLYSFTRYRYPKQKSNQAYAILFQSALLFVLSGGILCIIANKNLLQILLSLLLPQQGFAQEYTVSFQKFILFLNAMFSYTMNATSWLLLLLGSLLLGILPFCIPFIMTIINRKRRVRYTSC